MANEFIVPEWPAPAAVRALQTTRHGGCSVAPFAGCNLGDHVGDDPVAVARNRQHLRQRFPAEPLWLQQVHGTDVASFGAAPLPVADAAVGRGSGQVCVVMTADCLPLLLCDQGGTVVAAAHAGWRGLANGVIEATVRAMERPAGDLLAWLGPAIGPTAFEVGDAVHTAFVAADPAAARAFVAKTDGKWLADLYTLARQRLARLGVNRVFGGQWCTWSDPDLFYSYRRDGQTGRMGSFIWIEGV